MPSVRRVGLCIGIAECIEKESTLLLDGNKRTGGASDRNGALSCGGGMQGSHF